MPNKHGQLVITVDGSAASGKSTLAKRLAEKYNAIHIPYNLMFRLIAEYMIMADYVPDGREPTQAQTERAIAYATQLANSSEVPTILNQALDDALLGHEDVSHAAPMFARIPELMAITDAAIIRLIDASRARPVVVEGRTLGKYVYPNADVKFFVDANIDERGLRRTRGLIKDGLVERPQDGEFDMQTFADTVQEGLEWRDRIDQTREVQPAMYDPKIHINIDTTENTPVKTLAIAAHHVDKFLGLTGDSPEIARSNLIADDPTKPFTVALDAVRKANGKPSRTVH